MQNFAIFELIHFFSKISYGVALGFTKMGHSWHLLLFIMAFYDSYLTLKCSITIAANVYLWWKPCCWQRHCHHLYDTNFQNSKLFSSFKNSNQQQQFTDLEVTLTDNRRLHTGEAWEKFTARSFKSWDKTKPFYDGLECGWNMIISALFKLGKSILVLPVAGPKDVDSVFEHV